MHKLLRSWYWDARPSPVSSPTGSCMVTPEADGHTNKIHQYGHNNKLQRYRQTFSPWFLCCIFFHHSPMVVFLFATKNYSSTPGWDQLWTRPAQTSPSSHCDIGWHWPCTQQGAAEAQKGVLQAPAMPSGVVTGQGSLERLFHKWFPFDIVWDVLALPPWAEPIRKTSGSLCTFLEMSLIL